MKAIIAYAPGRVNIVGEYTDYTEGLALSFAIDKGTTTTLQLNGSASISLIKIPQLDLSFTIDLQHLQTKETTNHWENYIHGVLIAFEQFGIQLSGFDATIKSDLPVDVGLGSSTSLICSLIVGLDQLFNVQLSQDQLLQLASDAKTSTVNNGMKSQYASILGKKNHALLLDYATMDCEYVPVAADNYQFLLLDSQIKAPFEYSDYEVRKKACISGLSIIKQYFPVVTSFQEVTFPMILETESVMSDNQVKYFKHIVMENSRSPIAVRALKESNFHRLGQLIYQSHASLHNDYEVGCPELDFLSYYTHDKPYVLGSRMLGGGYGGCTLNLVEQTYADQFIDEIYTAYKKAFDLELNPYPVQIEDGATILSDYLV